MYLISKNGRLIVNMDNIADVYIYDNKHECWQINVAYGGMLPYVAIARYGNNEEEKCVKQFEAFKKALLAGEKYFDFSKEIE